MPAEFSEPPQWIIGYHNQMPTILSLLTPEYQQRLVQQLYHQAHDRAAQWSADVVPARGLHALVVRPRRAGLARRDGDADARAVSRRLRQRDPQCPVGRSFDLSGAVPRLGADVPRWMGETVGFWDGDALITWTSNIQGWFTHSSWEYSQQAADDRDLDAAPDPPGQARSGSSTRLSSTTRKRCYNRSATFASSRDRATFNDVPPNNLTHCNQNDLRRQRSGDAVGSRHRDPVPRRRSLRPAVGRRLGGVLRTGHAAAEGRGHLRLRTRVSALRHL